MNKWHPAAFKWLDRSPLHFSVGRGTVTSNNTPQGNALRRTLKPGGYSFGLKGAL